MVPSLFLFHYVLPVPCMYVLNRLYTFFERPVNSGPFPVLRCPLAVVRRFASSRRLARLSRWPVYPPSMLVGWIKI